MRVQWRTLQPLSSQQRCGLTPALTGSSLYNEWTPSGMDPTQMDTPAQRRGVYSHILINANIIFILQILQGVELYNTMHRTIYHKWLRKYRYV